MLPGSPSCFPSPTLPIPSPRHSNVRPDVPVHHGAGSAGRGCPEFTHDSRETEGTEPRVYTELLQAHPRQAWRPRGADGRHRGGNRKVGTHDEAAGFRREASSRGWREATATRAAHEAAEGVSRRDVGQPGVPSAQRVSTARGRGAEGPRGGSAHGAACANQGVCRVAVSRQRAGAQASEPRAEHGPASRGGGWAGDTAGGLRLKLFERKKGSEPV